MVLPLVNINNDRVDPSIRGSVLKFNGLINEFNAQPTLGKLQKIDYFANDLKKKFQEYPDIACSEMIKWILQNPVELELSQMNGIDLTKNKKKSFMLSHDDSTQGQNDVLQLNVWKNFTKPKLGGRSLQYTELDNSITRVEFARSLCEAEQFNNPIRNTVYFNVLTGLQDKVLNTILNDIPTNKPNMLAKFETLLRQTNKALHDITEKDEILKSQLQSPAVPVVGPNLKKDPQAMLDLVKYLVISTEGIQIGDFQIRFLGGNNNKNWLAVNEETEEYFVLRLEKSDDPVTDYVLVNQAKTHPQLSARLARDSFYYPTNEINLAQEYSRSFNFAVSEYCRHGDILSYRRRPENFPQDDGNENAVISKVVDMTRQVAMIACDFKNAHLPYMDIKADNFLIRDDGTVITADIKSLVRSDTDDAVAKSMIVTTFSPPEMNEKVSRINAEQFMTYQIGLMMYDLMLGQGEPKQWVGKYYDNNGALDFSAPIFATERGRNVELLIRAAMDTNPLNRPALAEFIDRCNNLNRDDVLELNELPENPLAHGPR
jgi:hypothetical protein